jgi:hypothetical protein
MIDEPRLVAAAACVDADLVIDSEEERMVLA